MWLRRVAPCRVAVELLVEPVVENRVNVNGLADRLPAFQAKRVGEVVAVEDGTAAAILVEGIDRAHYSAELAGSLEAHYKLIGQLQLAHDDVASYMQGEDFVTNFRHRAEAVAEDHGLTFNF